MNTDLFMIDGHAYSWRKLCELRREQLATRRAAAGVQAVLFELHADRRPETQCTAAGRFLEPSLLDLIGDGDRLR
jgi:hypothetical protein